MDKDKPKEESKEVKKETEMDKKPPEVHIDQEPAPTVEKKKSPLMMIVIVVILLIIVGGGIGILRSKGSSSDGPAPTATPFLPPADPNIVVELIPLDPGKAVDLRISKIPDDVTSVEYELKYKTSDKTEGVFGTAQVEENRVTREITLGTCSSGVCKYHTIPSGKGTLTIKFNSPNGATRFQEEFQLF